MTGILIGDQTYARLHRVALLRRDLIPRIAARVDDCFPGLAVSHIDLDKYHDNDEFAVDFSFIDLAARRWWVGTVFTGINDFENEVGFPLTWMRRITYLSDDIEAIVASVPTDQQNLARELVRKSVPLSVGFVSNPRPEWYEIAQRYEGQLAVLEAFTAQGDANPLIRVNGQLPSARGIHVGRCRALAGKTHILKLEGVALGDGLSHECSVEWDGEHLPWQATPLDHATLLQVPGAPPDLPRDEDLELHELAPNRYVLRRHDEEI